MGVVIYAIECVNLVKCNKMRTSEREAAPAVSATPRGPAHSIRGAMDGKRILKNAGRDEVRCTIFRESLARYRNELMDDEERQLLRDRVLKLKRELRLA
jgi:hypothetical protein